MGKKVESLEGRGRNLVSLTFDNKKHLIDLDEELSIDQQNMRDSFMDQAGKFAWYAGVHAAAMKRTDTLKMRIDVLRAEIDVAKAKATLRLKEEMTETSEPDKKGNTKVKVPSQAAIDAVIDGAKEVVDARALVAKAQASYVDARHEQEVVKAAKDAFVHRRDMLIQLGADVRQEQRDRG